MLTVRQKCANCEISFVAEAAGGQCTATFSVGMADVVYTLCSGCGARARSEGLRGISQVAQDSRLSPMLQRRVKVIVSMLDNAVN